MLTIDLISGFRMRKRLTYHQYLHLNRNGHREQTFFGIDRLMTHTHVKTIQIKMKVSFFFLKVQQICNTLKAIEETSLQLKHVHLYRSRSIARDLN